MEVLDWQNENVALLIRLDPKFMADHMVQELEAY
jgi:hypothetical protein